MIDPEDTSFPIAQIYLLALIQSCPGIVVTSTSGTQATNVVMTTPEALNQPPAYSHVYPTIVPNGISVLHEPSSGTPPVADLVFVHGLGGHPFKTWHTTFSPSAEQ